MSSVGQNVTYTSPFDLVCDNKVLNVQMSCPSATSSFAIRQQGFNFYYPVIQLLLVCTKTVLLIMPGPQHLCHSIINSYRFCLCRSFGVQLCLLKSVYVATFSQSHEDAAVALHVWVYCIRTVHPPDRMFTQFDCQCQFKSSAQVLHNLCNFLQSSSS